MYKAILIFVMVFLLEGCGFHPMLSHDNAKTTLPGIKVDRIPERMGQKLRLLLEQRIPPRIPAYHLAVALKESETSIALSHDATTNRYQLNITAYFTLTQIPQAREVLKSEASALSSYNVLKDIDFIQGSSEYSNVVSREAAEERALGIIADNIFAQVTGALNQQAALLAGPLAEKEQPPSLSLGGSVEKLP